VHPSDDISDEVPGGRRHGAREALTARPSRLTLRTHIVMRDTMVPLNDTGSERNPYVIASALRTLQVLHAFAVPPHRLGLADVVAKLELERNQAYRSLKTLEAAAFLTQTDDGRFELGPATAALAIAAARFESASVIDVAAPFLDQLAQETRETVHLFVRTGDRAVCVDRRDSPQSVRLVSVLGRSISLHAGAVPKAMLAFLPEHERNATLGRLGELPAYTRRTVTDRDALAAELDAIVERGYSVSDEDFDSAARGVGAPIFAPDGQVVAGVSVGGPSFRIDDATLARFAQLVRVAAGSITQRLALAGRP
jgi:DNA-binding IclR family transcriptional regulator